MINIFNLNNSAKVFKNIVEKIKDNESGWVNGKQIKIFEEQIKKKLNTNKEVCTCNSGSDALLLTLQHLKKKNKDIIITTPISYIASSSIAKFLGYEIIYIDIDKNNYLLDLNKLDNFLKNINSKIKSRLQSKYKNVLGKKTCSLHIRRGDYVRLSQFHALQPIDYYQNSVNIIGEEYEYLIFSDDIEWCKNNFNFIKNKHFIEGNTNYEDLYLMSICDNNIITNSSFSWWGAWMNKNETKKVISPKIWFGEKNSHLNTKDIYVKNWIII